MSKQEDNTTDTTTETPEVQHEDNLELHSLTFRGRQKARRTRLKKNMEGMSRMQKAGYIFSYYRWKIILLLLLIAICIALPVTIYRNTRPVAISYVIVNAEKPEELDTSFVQDYLDYYDISSSNRIMKDLDVHLDKETYLEEYNQNVDSSDYTELPLKCFNGYYDVIIMDKKGLEYCSMQEIIHPLKRYFSADIYNQIEGRIVDAADIDGIVVPFAVDISDTQFAKSLNLGYDDVYIGFPGANESNYKNSKRMLHFILGIDIEPN